MVMISGASSPLYAKRRRRNVITMGLSFAVRGFDLGYALTTHPLGVGNRISLSYAFGSRNADEDVGR